MHRLKRCLVVYFVFYWNEDVGNMKDKNENIKKLEVHWYHAMRVRSCRNMSI